MTQGFPDEKQYKNTSCTPQTIFFLALRCHTKSKTAKNCQKSPKIIFKVDSGWLLWLTQTSEARNPWGHLGLTTQNAFYGFSGVTKGQKLPKTAKTGLKLTPKNAIFWGSATAIF